MAKLLGKGEARSAAEDEVEDDHVGERRTGKTLAGPFDGMFKGDGCCPRGFKKILEIEGYDGLILDDQNRDIFELFLHAKGAFQWSFRRLYRGRPRLAH